jgi:tetratricopeptide (TPR) repeat protein
MSLFADVCDAVHHGHQKGIIHRDLKPGNILVDASGRVKIIDFGVARVTDSDLAVTTLQTDVGQLIGTLQYMSPEQCEADPHNIDIRSDVYALGVVFFELLTEQLPYDLSTKALSDATRVIREQPPTKPSAVNRRLHGDVETIALKALEKERDRRYQSALEFQQDIRRFLNAEAITARPPSVHYQLRVFARRHKAVTTSVATIMAILIGATAVSTLSLVRARRAEESALIEAGRARREAARSAEIARFTTDMLQGVKPSVALGRDTTMLREILDATAERVGKELAHEPELEATIRVTLGNTYRELGLFGPAKENLTQAAATFSRVLGPQDPRTLHAANSLAIVIQNQGHFDEAEGALRGTIEIQRRVQGEHHPNTMASINTLANSLFSQGRYAEAEELFRTNLAVQRRTLGVEHRDTLGTMNNLANTLRSLGRKTEAMDLVNETFEIRSKKLGAEHPDTLMSMSSVAIGLYNDGYFAEAGALFRKVVESQERVLGEEHPTTLSSMMNLGGCLANQGQYAAAEVVFRKSWEAQCRVLGEEHASTLLMANSLANSLRDQGRYAEAEEVYHQTLDSQRRVLREGHPETILSMENLANCLSNQDRYDEAEVVLREAIAIQRAKGAAPSAGTLHGLSAVLVKLERWTEAEPLCREARSIWASELPPGHRALELNGNLLGAILCGLGRYAEAEPLLVESYEKLRDDPGVRQERKKELLDRIVRLYDLWEVAEPDIRRAQQAAKYKAQ